MAGLGQASTIHPEGYECDPGYERELHGSGVYSDLFLFALDFAAFPRLIRHPKTTVDRIGRKGES